ncbi:hypothetical protein SKAU_G00198350 [Synaphobranchus kaupii]|uniref:Transferrin receptor protein 1 n=1 Tax=Synaphobranchus kaupii TaxID=118154 RepID=A0A9Q1IXL1_SYNKA|nr:hypothetical protein SKAU_G00198350 [Synaphobranchus kaupii]
MSRSAPDSEDTRHAVFFTSLCISQTSPPNHREGQNPRVEGDIESRDLERFDSWEAMMNDARSTISKIFNGEPRSYTRFNLTQNMEGDNSQVEMKLSSDVDEETGNPRGERNGYGHGRNSTYVQKPPRSPRNVCFMIVATLLIFVIGYLIGYLAHRKQDKESPSCSLVTAPDGLFPEPKPEPEEPPLDWGDLKRLLGETINENHPTGRLQRVFSQSTRKLL